jgi:hypothetical protein
MYVSKSVTFPTPDIGHTRHGLFFRRLDCQSNAKPSEKDHDLTGIRARYIWSSSQHTFLKLENIFPCFKNFILVFTIIFSTLQKNTIHLMLDGFKTSLELLLGVNEASYNSYKNRVGNFRLS